MHRRPLALTSLLLTLAFASGSYAAPLAIDLLDTSYTTFVSTSGLLIPGPGTTNNSRTMVSLIPISDSMHHDVSGVLEAEANAGLFSVSTFTAADGIHDRFRTSATASATTGIRFSPLSSGIRSVNLEFSGWGQWYFSEGFVRLFDATLNQEVWNFGWSGVNQGTVPWVDTGGDPRATATLTLNTDFNAANTYELTLYTATFSNPPDSERILIQLSGLQPVPEPSTFVILGLGLLALTSPGWRRKRS